jgi:hypothetical protein
MAYPASLFVYGGAASSIYKNLIILPESARKFIGSSRKSMKLSKNCLPFNLSHSSSSSVRGEERSRKRKKKNERKGKVFIFL